MIYRSILCLMMMVFWSLPLQAKPVIADLSDYDIRIDSSFTGTSLLLFGARNEPGDVIVVVRGPKKKFVVQKNHPRINKTMSCKNSNTKIDCT